jgi:hypothetical protein
VGIATRCFAHRYGSHQARAAVGEFDVSDARLIGSEDHVVALDYGTFNLITGDFEPDDYARVLDVAVDGIGQLPGLVSVASPHQNNFEMPLRVEVWVGTGFRPGRVAGGVRGARGRR